MRHPCCSEPCGNTGRTRMKIGLSIWEGRISPVFDVSTRLLIVELGDGGPVREEERTLESAWLPHRASTLVHWGVEVLICGAVSRPLLALLEGHGIEVRSFIAGDAREVLAAYLGGTLDSPGNYMPGCHGGRGGRRNRGPRGDTRGRGRGGGCQRRGNGRGRRGGPPVDFEWRDG